MLLEDTQFAPVTAVAASSALFFFFNGSCCYTLLGMGSFLTVGVRLGSGFKKGRMPKTLDGKSRNEVIFVPWNARFSFPSVTSWVRAALLNLLNPAETQKRNPFFLLRELSETLGVTRVHSWYIIVASEWILQASGSWNLLQLIRHLVSLQFKWKHEHREGKKSSFFFFFLLLLFLLTAEACS